MTEMSKSLSTNFIIVAPHPDDEIIGAYEVLNEANNKITVFYSSDTNLKRREETLNLRKHFTSVKAQLFQTTIPQPFLQKSNKFFFPDPSYEIHPHHRQWGFLGEQLARQGFDVTFYSTIMNAPYIHEVEFPLLKKEALDEVYPSQKSLWEFDHKYFIFEGKCKWMF
jgi:hypothetical protein